MSRKKQQQKKAAAAAQKSGKFLDGREFTTEELDELLVYFNDRLMAGLKRDLLRGKFEEGFDEDSSLDRLERGQKFKEAIKKGKLSQEQIEKYLAK